MIDPARLLGSLQKILPKLEDDLRERSSQPEHDAGLRDAWAQAKKAERTAEPFESWRDAYVTQVAVAWLMSGVFVRFIEDNDLIDVPLIAGPTDPARGNRWKRADDEYQLYFRAHPTHSDRDWFLHVFSSIQALPAAADLFRRRNLVWALGPSGDMAGELRAFWRRIDPNVGVLELDFSGHRGDTRFLGDLYQDLSEDARKRYALLQTPGFVESFILDRTLTPAMREFGLSGLRLIDPTCGSGHFLLGAFERLLEAWRREAPGEADRELVRRALDSVYGVDLNPFAVAIARFRLLEAALSAAGIERLKEAPAWPLHVTVADSLIHGGRWDRMHSVKEGAQLPLHKYRWNVEVYSPEQELEVDEVLGHRYHVVVGNPPYIVPQDAKLNEVYRRHYASCHRQYSLGAPFTERFFDLAIGPVDPFSSSPAGFVGLITANSFMKREFGSRLIETIIPHLDLTAVIDTAGAYIPGHGTPTVILLGRNREPVGTHLRAVLGSKGEPGTPDDPAQGLVWRSIVKYIDEKGFENEHVSIVDMERKLLYKHPWSLGGGGALDLKELIEDCASSRLEEKITSIGFMCITKQDDVFSQPERVWARLGAEPSFLRPFGVGEFVRDWSATADEVVAFPYLPGVVSTTPDAFPNIRKFLMTYKSSLENRAVFGGGTFRTAGRNWWEYGQIPPHRFQSSLSIVFGFVATHNHFVFDRGGKVFKQSAPVIKLPAGATEDDHLALTGLLNSSTGAFWMRQVFHNKGLRGQGGGITSEGWEQFYEYDGTKIQQFPLPPDDEQTLPLARELDRLARELQAHTPAALVKREPPTREALEAAREASEATFARMVALQEELDWRCYRLYGLLPDAGLEHDPDAVPGLKLGERAFEIVMARRMADGKLSTTWFERHGSTPLTTLPAHWPDRYRATVERRIALIERSFYSSPDAQARNLGLIERPEHKRRWSREPWEAQVERAVRSWLLDRLETPRYFPQAARMVATNGETPPAHTPAVNPALIPCSHLADLASRDPDFLRVGALYRGREDFDLLKLVTGLVLDEAIPFLPVQRYKESGLRKRALWEQTWALQRLEDALEARMKLPEGDPRRLSQAERDKQWKDALDRRKLTAIPVPPKYTSADFLPGPTWRLRGKLDVPKERFILYPGAERDADGTPVVAWAGLDHLEQARALSAWYLERKDEAWSAERLTPLLAGLDQLVPWLEQWHSAYDPAYAGRPCDYFRDFVADECRALDLTLEQLRAWTPPAKGGRGRKAKGKGKATQGALFG